jgi:hypothetical protein
VPSGGEGDDQAAGIDIERLGVKLARGGHFAGIWNAEATLAERFIHETCMLAERTRAETRRRAPDERRARSGSIRRSYGRPRRRSPTNLVNPLSVLLVDRLRRQARWQETAFNRVLHLRRIAGKIKCQ